MNRSVSWSGLSASGRRGTIARVALLAAATAAWPAPAPGATISNSNFNVQVGTYGEITSLKIAGDKFPTNYVLNASNAPSLARSPEHHWLGELMFTYRLGSSAWSAAETSRSDDARTITSNSTSVTVTYQNSSEANGIRNFKVVETYSLVDDCLSWQIAVTNTANQTLEIGDFGLPLPWNQYWFVQGDEIYETRVQSHSFVGNNSSYITVTRPSGMGPYVLMVPDARTGAGFEYRDTWHIEEHPGSAWTVGQGSPSWPDGLNVFYIHSSIIKSTGRGYLSSTSLVLPAGASKTYSFKLFKVASVQEMKNRLYTEGLIDVTVVPGMAFTTDLTAKFDLRTSKNISSVNAQYPSETTITSLGRSAGDHNIYELKLKHLGQNDITVSYGDGEKTVLQFYAMEPAGAALQRHATFIVEKTQWTDKGVDQYGVFDDWLMKARARRGAFSGGWGWGDDWGWTHGQFLAEKNALTPVASEVSALDVYLDAVWNRAIDHSTYVVQNWWCPAGTSPSNPRNCYYDRAFAYPHAFNTYFSMYKIARYYPKLVQYHNSADTYLMRAYNILNALYSGHGDPGTGYMGEATLPEIQQALRDEGHSREADRIREIIISIYDAFRLQKYPYGSEYSFDNTGEEAVYMSARENGNADWMKKINDKSRACRGEQPVWYHYANPVTLNGEGWWIFQYSMSLIGWCLDDWLRFHSSQPELDERINYAAKLGNLTAINSGQISSDPANIGAVAWTYQAEKGKVVNCYKAERDIETLHNNWRGMSGESDLGLWGAIRILSADVTVDPIFGLYGYGSDVTTSSGCYTVTPRDGVQKRLSLITEKVYLELERDQYTSATLSNLKNYVAFTLKNQYTAEAHVTKVTLRGLAPGSYNVKIDGASASTVNASAGQPTVVKLSIGTKASYEVVLSSAGSSCEGRTDGDVDGGSQDSGGGGVDAGADARGGAKSDAGRDSGGSAREDAGESGSEDPRDEDSGAGEEGGASGSEVGIESDAPGACGCASSGAPDFGALVLLALLTPAIRRPAVRRLR